MANDTGWANQYDESGGETAQASAPAMWPAGNYKAAFIRHELISSQMKGTPGIRIFFGIGEDQAEVYTDIWLTDASAEIAMTQLGKVGWNGEYDDKAEFAVSGEIDLYLKYEEYKGKQQARWSISTFERKPPPKTSDPALTRFSARFKAQNAAPAAPPTGKPATPPKTAAGTPPKPPGAKPGLPPKPSQAKVAAAVAERTITNQDEAWKAWVDAKLGNDPEGFWARVGECGGGAEPEAMTAEQWAKFAGMLPPF